MDRVETGLISHIGRIRGADPKQVSALAESIKEVGLLNPISVYRTSIVRNGKSVDGYGLIAGFHRLRACQSLGWDSIPAVILDLDEQRRIIAECDENLCGSVLTPAERATFTAKRKDAYETLHPEAKHGANQHTREGGAKSASPSFAEDQSAKTGQAKRTIQLDAERGARVCDEALALIRGTRLDTGVYLDQIKKLDPAAQVDRATADLKPKPQKPVDVSGARRAKIDADVKDRAAREVAEIIAEHVPADLWDGVKANLYAAGANIVASALTNITGQSIMDRRGWE